MKLIYTHENRMLVSNAKNIVENAGIEVSLKNEYAAGAAGDLAVFDTWLELWVVDDADYEKAKYLVEKSLSSSAATEWVCKVCNEKNAGSFELCWNCQAENHCA